MGQTIPETFFETVEKFSKKTAFLYKRDGVYFPITYQEIAEKVKIFSSALSALGITKGDKVAILSENRPEWAISDLAIMSIGAVVVPLHTTFSPKAIRVVLDHSEAKILIVSNSDLLHKTLLEKSKLKYLEKIIFFQKPTLAEKENLDGKIFNWETIISRNRKNTFKKIYLESDDVCTIIYTSGTTGVPKGVIITHKNFLSNIESVTSVIPVKENDIFLSFLPLSHVLERMAGYYSPLFSGATIAYAENIKQLPINLKEIKPTVLIAVPRIFEKFYDAVWDKVRTSNFKNKLFHWALKQKRGTFKHKIGNFLVFKKIKKGLGGRLRLTVSGGATLNERISRFFYKIGIIILDGYGLTETSPVVAVNREKDFKFGTVGKPVPEVRVRISPEKEILVKGPNVTRGYFKNKKTTRESFAKDNWFRTGDMGFLSEEGFLTVIGRIKEIIVTSGGKNVWPEPIENRLNKDRFIINSIIVGNKQRFISALIVPDWEEIEIWAEKNNIKMREPEKMIKNQKLLDVFQERIDKKINPNLSNFEKIKKFKLLIHDFSQERDELTPTLKLRRHIILYDYRKEIEKIYS